MKEELLFTKQREYMMITWCDINICAEQLINLTQSVFVALVQKTSQFKVTSDEIANYARFVTEAMCLNVIDSPFENPAAPHQ